MFGWSFRTLDSDGRPYALAYVHGRPLAGRQLPGVAFPVAGAGLCADQVDRAGTLGG
jgi:hypothetical protein